MLWELFHISYVLQNKTNVCPPVSSGWKWPHTNIRHVRVPMYCVIYFRHWTGHQSLATWTLLVLCLCGSVCVCVSRELLWPMPQSWRFVLLDTMDGDHTEVATETSVQNWGSTRSLSAIHRCLWGNWKAGSSECLNCSDLLKEWLKQWPWRKPLWMWAKLQIRIVWVSESSYIPQTRPLRLVESPNSDYSKFLCRAESCSGMTPTTRFSSTVDRICVPTV